MLGGCDASFEPGVGLPLQVTADVAFSKLDPVAEVTAVLRNRSTRDLTLKQRCTVINIEREESGAWIRIDDLRQCAPPDRINLPALTTLTIVDQRTLAPGRYRVVIEAIDERQAHSNPFTLPAIR